MKYNKHYALVKLVTVTREHEIVTLIKSISSPRLTKAPQVTETYCISRRYPHFVIRSMLIQQKRQQVAVYEEKFLPIDINLLILDHLLSCWKWGCGIQHPIIYRETCDSAESPLIYDFNSR